MADTDISEDEMLDEDGEKPVQGPPPGKKGHKKLIIFALVGLLVAGGAAGGAYVFLLGNETVAEQEDVPPVIENLRRIGYVNIKPIFIQVQNDKGVYQNLVVELALEVEKDSRDEERIKLAMPLLFESYLRTLTARPIPGAADGKVEVSHIKNRIRAENLRILGPGAVHNVIMRNIWISEG